MLGLLCCICLLKAGVGNMNCNVVGFDDMYSCLFMIPVAVCLIVVIRLGWDNYAHVHGDLLPKFEVVWLTMPVLIFCSLGLGSIGLRSLIMEEDNDLEIALAANQ